MIQYLCLATALKNFVRKFNVPENLFNILKISVGKARETGFPIVRLGVDEVTY